MGYKGLIVAAALAVALAGCASTRGGSFCKVMTDADGKPIVQPSSADIVAVSDQLAAGLVTVLETGEKECGWKVGK